MFNPAPETPALIKHTWTNQGLQDCLEIIHFSLGPLESIYPIVFIDKASQWVIV